MLLLHFLAPIFFYSFFPKLTQLDSLHKGRLLFFCVLINYFFHIQEVLSAAKIVGFVDSAKFLARKMYLYGFECFSGGVKGIFSSWRKQ